jgi:hypothetical protein
MTKQITLLIVLLLTGGAVMAAEPAPWTSGDNVLKIDTSGISPTPTLVVTAPGTDNVVTVMWTREKLEELAKDDHWDGTSGYAILALEILRLRDKCGEQETPK